MTMMRWPGGTSAPRYYHPDRVAEAIEDGWEVVGPVSDDLTPRNVIARAIATKAENDPESFGYYMGETDGVLAALDAAGWSITRQPDEWQWAHRDPDGEVHGPMPSEAVARKLQDKERGFSRGPCGLVRRPVTPWEVVPDVE